MFKKISAPATFSVAAILTFGAVVMAETPTDPKAKPTPTAKPQNQSIVNTSKSNTKDHRAPVASPTPNLRVTPKIAKESHGKVQDKGWDGKVQGKQETSPTASPTPAKSR